MTWLAVAGLASLAACGGVPFRASIGSDGGDSPQSDAGTSSSAGDDADTGVAASGDDSAAPPSDAGTVVDAAGGTSGEAAAPGPSSTFACGSSTCDKATQYCFVKGTGSGRQSACRDIPTPCVSSPSCGCIETHDSQCASPSCISENGDFTVTCALL